MTGWIGWTGGIPNHTVLGYKMNSGGKMCRHLRCRFSLIFLLIFYRFCQIIAEMLCFSCYCCTRLTHPLSSVVVIIRQTVVTNRDNRENLERTRRQYGLNEFIILCSFFRIWRPLSSNSTATRQIGWNWVTETDDREPTGFVLYILGDGGLSWE